MNKYLVMAIVGVAITLVFSISLISDQTVNAKTLKKIQFTNTITSMQDPSQGDEGQQLAIILTPNKGAIYDGSMTYTASEPVQIFVLHEINKTDAKGQPIWTVDGDTIFGLSTITPGTNSGSFEFTGAALALHTNSTNRFTATVSVDGWIRGQTTEITEKKVETIFESTLKLSRPNVETEIPLHKGFFDGNSVYYIITDTNDKRYSKMISEAQNWKVEFSSLLGKVSTSSLSDVYVFLNGTKGNGTQGFQNDVFSDTPKQLDQYSPYRSVIHVSWNSDQPPEILDSVQKIMDAKNDNKIKLEKTNDIINMPQIIWPEGKLLVSENRTVDKDPEENRQLTEINTNKMIATFKAHRAWGSDGRTIYYIITDATPSSTATLLGASNTPNLAKSINGTLTNLYQFSNGIKSSGPLGFQPSISSTYLDDDRYNPVCRISLVTWIEPERATLLETISDIEFQKDAGKVTVEFAKALDDDYLLNCPIIEPFNR